MRAWNWAPAVLVAGALVALVLVNWGDEGAQPQTPAVPAQIPADPLSYPREGLRLARPARWSAERRGGVIRLRSSDRRVGIAIVRADRSRVPRAVLRRDLERSVRSTPGVRLDSRSRAPLGDAPALLSEFTVVGDGTDRQEIVVLAAESRWATYGVTIFSSRRAPVSTMPDVAAVLDSFEFSAVR